MVQAPACRDGSAGIREACVLLTDQAEHGQVVVHALAVRQDVRHQEEEPHQHYLRQQALYKRKPLSSISRCACSTRGCMCTASTWVMTRPPMLFDTCILTLAGDKQWPCRVHDESVLHCTPSLQAPALP